MNITDEGLALIKRFEGFSSQPYRCSAGVWTIGYGHTRGVNARTPPISKDEAEQWLREDVSAAEAAVRKYVRVRLAEQQFSALVSFVFNVGEGAFARSSLLKKLNAGKDAAPEFMRWVYAGGKRLAGLENRRKAEMELFMKEGV